jgi:membrane protease YdiL (CAAX protease family)
MRMRALAWPFVGPHGLRGGWRVLIFLVLFAAGSIVVEKATPLPAGDLPAIPLLTREVLGLLVVVGATLLLGLFEKRTLGDYGLPLRRREGLGPGLALGFGAQTALLLVLAACGALTLATALAPAAVLPNALRWGLVFLAVAFFEELLLRGYAQATLARSIGFWPAAVLLSVLFALMHRNNPGETLLGLVAVFVFGLFFCYTLRATGTLWMAVGFHAAWDWAESFFYGVPDSGMHMAGHLLDATFSGPAWLSGGTAGPEGSVLIPVTLISAGLLVARYPWGSRRSPLACATPASSPLPSA